MKLPAYAYLDGGSASMLLQVLVAGLLGVALFWKNLLWRVKSLFGGGSKDATPQQPEESSDDD